MTHEYASAANSQAEGTAERKHVPTFAEISAKSAVQYDFLGKLAAQSAAAITYNDAPDRQLLVIENFEKNVARVIPEQTPEERHDFSVALIERMKQLATNETTALLKAQNDLLLAKQKAMLEILADEPSVLAKLRPYLEPPVLQEVKPVESIPSTDELEEMVMNVTDESFSPSRGTSIEMLREASRRFGHGVMRVVSISTPLKMTK